MDIEDESREVTEEESENYTDENNTQTNFLLLISFL